MAATEQYFSSVSDMACFTAASSSVPRRRKSISSLVQTVGGSAARSPEQITSSDSNLCRFFSRMITMSVAVQAPSASSTSSIGPGALFDSRSESTVIACPDGLVATNFCSPIHFTDPVCMRPPCRKHSRTWNLKRARQIPIGVRIVFWFKWRGPACTLNGGERREQMQIPISKARRRLAMAVLGLAALLWSSTTGAAARQGGTAAEGKDQPYVIEYYYKTKWGHAEEFLALFKKNHYPVLKKEIELGRMLKVSMAVPRYHTTEDGRWDYRVTIVFKNAAIANDNFDSAALIKQLYPDQETYKKEEQRRFEILEAHWDLPIKDLDLDAR